MVDGMAKPYVSPFLRLLQGTSLLPKFCFLGPASSHCVHLRPVKRLFCKTFTFHVLLHTCEDTKDNSLSSGDNFKTEVHDMCEAKETTEALAEVRLIELRSHKVSRILQSGVWNSSTEECLRPYATTLSTSMVARVLNLVTNVDTAKSFFHWAGQQDAYRHSTFVYNALLMKLGLAKDFVALWGLLRDMERDSCRANNTTFSTIIHCYGKAGLLEECWRTLTKAETFGVKPDAHVYTALLHVLFDAGKVLKAKQLLGKMMKCKLDLDLHTWSTIINGLCKTNRLQDAEEFFKQLVKGGCVPNVYIYNALIMGFHKSKDPKRALFYFDMMKEKGCKPDVYTYNALVDINCTLDNADEAERLLSEMEHAGCRTNQVTYNTLLKGLFRKGKVKEADELFYRMQKERHVDQISYRIYAVSVRRLGDVDKLISVSEKMFARYGNCSVDICNAILQYFCNIGNLNRAAQYFWEDLVRLTAPDEFSFALVINALCKAGHLDAAQSQLSQMISRGCKPSGINYDPFIITLCKNSQEDKALHLFAEMDNAGLQTSPATCEQLLKALSDRGLVDGAIMLCKHVTDRRHAIRELTVLSFVKCLNKLGRLEEANTLIKALQHRGCLPKSKGFKYALVAMLNGNTDDAENFLMKRMPNSIAYVAMLHGLCKRGELGKAKKLLSQMKEQGFTPSISCYNPLIVGLSKKQGKLMESLELFEEMVEMGVSPSCALPSILMGRCCQAKEESTILRLGKLIVDRAWIVHDSTVDYLFKQDQNSKLRQLFNELFEHKCVVRSVAAFNANAMEGIEE